ncbi:MAG: hypothetical protein B6I18_08570 [Bacteroidetes bacterium 4572_112]|nr:MAG: hypothetical protein B6I18_08570 [Bacteroidetes bacterium 4572_112]
MKNLLVLLILFVSISVNAQEKQLTDEEKVYGLSLIWQEVNYNYAYLENYNLDWDSVYTANIPKVVAAKNLTEYYSILSGIINSFHEEHTTIISPLEVQKKYGYVPISLSYINGKYYVTAFSSEYKDKVFIGSVLTNVNSYDVNDYYDKFVFPNCNLSEHIAKRQVGKGIFFFGLLNKKLRATFLNPDGKTVSLKLKRRSRFTEAPEEIKVPKMYQDTAFLFKKYGDISYIRIKSFLTNTPSTSFAKIVDSLKNSKAIIFDVRANIGGNSQFATDIISYFSVQKSMPLWWGQQKVNRGFYKAAGVYTYLHGDSLAKANNYYAEYIAISHYEGGQYNWPNNTNGELKDIPVIVLCNYLTVSSAETFILQLKQVASVTVIGEPTAGSATMALEVQLPGGGGFNVAASKALDENGKPYKYTQPDIIHIPSLEDEKTGNDSVLKIAIDLINNEK